MRKNFLNNRFIPGCLLGSIFLFTVSSCKTAQQTVGAAEPVILKEEPADLLFEKVAAQQFLFNWLSAKASVEYVDHNNDQTGFSINMRMAKDSLIWLSVSPLLGIEAVRVLISRDSIRLLDRVHQTAIVRDYRYLEDLLKSKVTFGMLQAMLTGSFFMGVEGDSIQSVYAESPNYILSTIPKLQTLRSAEEKYPDRVVQDFWVDTSYHIVKTRLDDEPQHRALSIEYADFTTANGRQFPRKIRLSIESVKPSRIAIDYNKLAFDGPLTFPFYVPEKYSRD